MVVKIAFYKKHTSLYTRGITLVQTLQFTSKPQLIHCEFVIGKQWYTSSYNDGGVRVREISGESGNWDFIYLDIPINGIDKARRFLEGEMGKEYDIEGIFLAQLFPLNIDSPQRWFCSEIVSEALMIAGVLPRDRDSSWYSPARLYDRLQEIKIKY